ncbi:MAG: rRNA maturation RNase YbeY [Bacteroidetes bacterium]|mgnify:CR=1 FL=1|jgi:probable rRNA maturation factor|nr:rRNA maturation RNase YbeY [Bacteroidota bacterium]MBT3802325.1 rRNA maturation RNase YbeY [Bacteroidota bacterium]MBT4339787.1 rRNA maturation RNase YbeY [Bacteroidota bacterium]MBT4967585.1 rRNA maturation RNase YbeY [Bacteroidota bacterium]MBT5992292.1 rRNA maturation RNase YbeY [Bacteroidota bacterium]
MIRLIGKQNEKLQDNLLAVINMIVKKYNKSYKYININLLDDEELLNINTKYLHKDDLTDTISFNYSENLDIIEGDLYISTDRIKENARNIGVDEANELNRVIIHGVLHLCGENDYTSQEKTNMTHLENKFLGMMVSRGT